MKYSDYFQIGDRVESRATFEHYGQQGTVIDLKKPHYINPGTFIVPLLPVVRFDSGEAVRLKSDWLIKVK